MKKFLFGILIIIGCSTILGCDIDFNDVPSTTVFYDVGFYEPCCYDVIYYYKEKN